PELELSTGLTRHCSSTESDGSVTPVNIVVALTVDGSLNVDEFRNLFYTRVLQKRDRNGNLMFGKFYKTITQFLGYPCWTREKKFELANHIVEFDYHREGVNRFDENRLKTFLTKLMNEPWVNGKSYWNITLVPDYNEEVTTLIILKWQHALADGFSMRSVLEALSVNETIPMSSNENSDSRNVKALANNIRLGTQMLKNIWKTLMAIFLFPYDLASFKAKAASHDVNLWVTDVNARRDEYEISFTKSFPVDAIKSAQAKFGVGFQTVLFTAVSAALERALKKYDLPIAKMLLADYSKPVIPHPKGLTNSL
ncbi:unnamed protein product, partial [Allacma fusca]